MSGQITSEHQALTEDMIYSILATVKDPEIPVISIQDLGVLQRIKISDDKIQVGIIPTYSGCPAMHVIKIDIKAALCDMANQYGINEIEVKLFDKPIWTTDMITANGRAAMQEYGIAPPLTSFEKSIECPQCKSENTTCISEFGSTACKALYRCENCLEPFDYFKCHA